MSHYSVYLGAVGWSHPEWVGDFYPEDMPNDWLLAFYNSQFRCVFLPFPVWRDATDEEVSGWLGDTREGFVFILQSPDIVDEKIEQQADRFGERGIDERQANLLWLEGEPDLRYLAQSMRQAAQGSLPLFIVSRDGSMAQLRQVKELMEVLGA